jgi:hypothetical protein
LFGSRGGFKTRPSFFVPRAPFFFFFSSFFLLSFDEKRKTKNEKRKTKNEKRKTKNEKRKTKNEPPQQYPKQTLYTPYPRVVEYGLDFGRTRAVFLP